MKIVLLTALGVGGASVIGALLGFAFKKISHHFSDIVLAIAIHNLPEGIAAGVGFGTGNTAEAVTIALQNIPEGMVIIGPMLAAGMSHSRTFKVVKPPKFLGY